MRDGGAPRSLANAFVKPVRPSRDEDLVALSARALAGYAAALDKVYGTKGRAKGGLSFIALDADGGIAETLGKALPYAADLGSLDELVTSVTAAAFGATT